MNHYLVAVLPESLQAAPLDTEILAQLNLLSVKAIMSEQPHDHDERQPLMNLKNRGSFPQLVPIAQQKQNMGYRLLLDRENETEQGSVNAVKCEIPHNDLLPPNGLEELIPWLASTTRKWIAAPLALLPVVRAIMNIYPLDPYLATHYMRQFQPLLDQLSTENLDCILTRTRQARYEVDENLPAEINKYLRLERKLHRQYIDH
jgi:hypothetical protein